VARGVTLLTVICGIPSTRCLTSLLVKKGVLFENRFVATALFAPSRWSVLSGN
jgi:hypothetical protein